MPPVVITGLGVVSPLGHSVEALLQGVAASGPPYAHDRERALTVAEIPLEAIPPDKRSRIGRLDRLCRMFLSASYLAVDSAALTIAPAQADRVGLSFGTGLGCLLTNAEYNQKIIEQGPAAASPRLFAYTVSSAAAGEVSIALGIRGPNVTAHMGLAAGLGAVGYGFDLIQMGKADVVLAGGADVLGSALLEGLDDMGLLKAPEQSRPFADAVAGIWPSEGAVVVVLERQDHAGQRGARALGRIDGYGAGFEPSLTRRARECTGISATMRRALDLSGHVPEDIALVLAGAHGTPLDASEQAALAQLFGPSPPLVLAPKAVLGESFAASGVLALALAAGVMRPEAFCGSSLSMAEEGLLEPPVVMVNALCYSGNIVSLVLSREETS